MLSILQVSTSDVLGGAERVAADLFRAYRQRGHRSWLAVGHRSDHDPDVFLVPNDQYRKWGPRLATSLGNWLTPFAGRIRGAARLRELIQAACDAPRLADILRGREDFHFPGTWKLLNLLPNRPDVIHCHNLHGYYFDLRALPWLATQAPLLLTLHDGWLLSGHCAHSFECNRWQEGCGSCPDLRIYPAVWRDATASNWQRKKNIFAASKIYVATPSNWLMQRVEQSMLTSAVLEGRVIPNGVDLSIFHPVAKKEARRELGLPYDAKVLVFAAANIRKNMWKDYETVRAAVRILSTTVDDIMVLAIGDEGRAERIGKATVTFVPYQHDRRGLARYYQAADVYVHAARAETWGLTITEALACGTPVVATAVGGVVEQVENNETGFLVAMGDGEGMAARVLQLITNKTLVRQYGERAADSARRRFDLRLQADRYLDWYYEIVDRSASHRTAESVR